MNPTPPVPHAAAAPGFLRLMLIAASLLLLSEEHAMTAAQPAPATAAAQDIFMLEYDTANGPPGLDGASGLQYFVRLDRKDHSAYRWVLTPPGRGQGAAIGEFRTTLPDQDFQEILDLVKAVGLADLPAPTEGGPGISMMTLTLRQGQTSVSKEFSSRDGDIVNRVLPLLEKLHAHFAQLEKSPDRALAVEVEPLKDLADRQFKITLRNPGRAPISIVDPRRLKVADENRWCGILVAEAQDERKGAPAVVQTWSRIGLLPPDAKEKETDRIDIPAGGTFTLTTQPWPAAKAGTKYVVQAVFSEYRGPTKVPTDSYAMRGAAFSKIIPVTPK